jgi:hypothetical protein
MLSKVERIVPQADEPNLAGGVVVNGSTLACDFVIMGVGVAPATQFLKGTGIQIEKDGGVRVDEYMRVRSVPSGDVYAIGDIAIYPQRDGSETRIEHWNVGEIILLLVSLKDLVRLPEIRDEQSVLISEGSNSPLSRYPSSGVLVCAGNLTDILTHFDMLAEGQQLRYCGVGADFEEVIIQGNSDDLKVSNVIIT